jgi:hypothetical protein
MIAFGLLAAWPAWAVLPDVPISGRSQAAIDAALASCRAQANGGGCRMIAPAGTITGTLAVGPGLAAGFELVCAGRGTTIWQAPIPHLTDHIVRIGDGAPDNGSIHACTFDGRKQSQPRSVVAGGVKSVAIAGSNPQGSAGPSGWHIYDIETRNTLGGGITQRQGANWEIDHNYVHDSGCSPELPCPVIEASGYCAQRAANPVTQHDNCVDGMGIQVLSAHSVNAYVHHNEVWNVAKACVTAFNNGSRYPGDPPSGFTFADNYVHECGFNGVNSNGGIHGTITRNRAENVGGQKALGTSNGNCYSSTGYGHDLEFSHNVCIGAMTHGMFVIGGGLITVTNNVVERACTQNLHYPAMAIGSTGYLTPSPGVYTVAGNAVRRGPSFGCRYALFAQQIGGGSTIRGNNLEGSRRTEDAGAASAVRFESMSGAGASMTGNYIDGGASRKGITVSGTVKVSALTFDGTNQLYLPNGTACGLEPGQSGATPSCGPPTMLAAPRDALPPARPSLR